jgi:hypothetical protein
VTLFVDVGAKRIQAYLARTPSLKGRRGGSALLDRDELLAATEPAYANVAEINPEGKETDGVLSFRLHGGIEAAQDLVSRLVARLRAYAPAAEWEVHVSTGASYRDALEARQRAERCGQMRWQTELSDLGALPVAAPLGEVPVLRLCSECGLDQAERPAGSDTGSEPSVDLDGQPVHHCPDCARRFAVAGHRESAPAENGILQAVARRRPRLAGASHVTTFEQLAKLGAEGKGRNHLCTVFVDGNRFGPLFSALKESGTDLRTLSRSLATAMREALIEAAVEVTADDADQLPVITHLLGGDDLLVSVVADQGWRLTTTLLREYERRVAREVEKLGAGTAPTASAGIVVAHCTFPLATSVDLAEKALRAAKNHFTADRSAVQWVDVTVDGPIVDPYRRPLSLADLDARSDALHTLADLPAAGRKRLAELYARDPRDDPDAAVYRRDLIRTQAARLGVLDAVIPFLAPDTPVGLPDALRILRWWS